MEDCPGKFLLSWTAPAAGCLGRGDAQRDLVTLTIFPWIPELLSIHIWQFKQIWPSGGLIWLVFVFLSVHFSLLLLFLALLLPSKRGGSSKCPLKRSGEPKVLFCCRPNSKTLGSWMHSRSQIINAAGQGVWTSQWTQWCKSGVGDAVNLPCRWEWKFSGSWFRNHNFKKVFNLCLFLPSIWVRRFWLWHWISVKMFGILYATV